MEQQEQEFTKGFNNGFLIAQYESEIASMVVKDIKSDSHYFQGLIAGKQEYELNKNRYQIKDNDRSRNKGDIEKER